MNRHAGTDSMGKARNVQAPLGKLPVGSGEPAPARIGFLGRLSGHNGAQTGFDAFGDARRQVFLAEL